MHDFGDRTRFRFEVGPVESALAMRRVDIWAAGRWLTSDDNSVYVPAFTYALRNTLRHLLRTAGDAERARPFPQLSVAENLQRLLREADAGNNAAHLSYQFMAWGPTTDNVCACLFREGGTAFIPFSFWRAQHHEPLELGKIFVAELPENELLLLLHETSWALTGSVA